MKSLQFRIPFLLYIFLVVVSVGYAQQQPTPQNGDYYFPVNNFTSETTYCYVNQYDSTEKSYWKMKTSVSNKDTFLSTSIFDANNRINETLVEKISNRNSIIVSYIIYDYNKEGIKFTANCNIVDSMIFKTNQTLNETIQWKIRYKYFQSPSNCELLKNRTLIAQNSNQLIFTDSLKFSIIETKQGYSYYMISTYQKGKGLIAYKLVLPDGSVKDFILSTIEKNKS